MDNLIDEVQTKRVNSIFSSIPLIATDLAQQKSGEPVKINQFSARVTSSDGLSNFLEDIKAFLK